VITSLTGGDPQAFCNSGDDLINVMTAWALADLAKPAAARGLPALAYGPAVDRLVRALLPVTPLELARQLQPSADQSAAAVAALRDAGFDDAAIEAMADAVIAQLSGPNPDSVLAEQLVIEQLDGRLGRDGTIALAASFDQAHPTVPAVFDLGDVSRDVAASAGYECLAPP
jgi:hypothetical protein